jgi:hypothetical protein
MVKIHRLNLEYLMRGLFVELFYSFNAMTFE